MKFEYTYRNTPVDFWRYFLGNIYRQWTGLVNVVFIASIIALIISRWNTAGPMMKAVMGFALSLFVIIQPLAMYGRAVKETERIGDTDTTLLFDQDGLNICVKAHSQFIPWKTYHNVIARHGFLMIIPDEAHAYILPDRVTGSQKQELLQFIKEHMGR